MFRSYKTMRLSSRCLSSFTASVTKVHRTTFSRRYPTVLVFPDGSSTIIKFHEPRSLIALPLDMDTLSDDQKRARLEKRRPKSAIHTVETIRVAFDPTKYIKKRK